MSAPRKGGRPGGRPRAARPEAERERPGQAGRSRPRGAEAPELSPELTVYGRHPLREALAGPRVVEQVWATASAARELESDDQAKSLGPNFDRLRNSIELVESARLEELSGSRDHQGLVARVSGFAYCTLDDLLEEDVPVIFGLDQITDPHNLGAIARVCDASGATGMVVPEHRSARVTAAVCKASAGAIEHVRVAVVPNLADALKQSKGPQLWVYGASEHGTRAYTQADYRDGVLFVMGSEGAGIRPRVQSHCDDLVQIPMLGTVGSLNVSTVAALLAYEVVRQRSEPAS